MAALPDYVDMMSFNLGSAASMQKVEGQTGGDVSTYIYVMAILAFVATVEGVILFMRRGRIG
jgi:hypothetical protein